MSVAGPERMIFVGGAPRSGTTVAHALICTANRVSHYNPEISFFRGFMHAFRNGKVAWDGHTSGFFESRDTFRDMIRQVSDLALERVWTALERPPLLAVKDPHLTPYFTDLHELYPQTAQFVTACRHPYDVVRSRQEVHARSQPNRPFSRNDAIAVAREYFAYYRSVLGADFHGQHMLLRYEDLNDDATRGALATFLGLDGFRLDRLWAAANPEPEDDAWGSPKYYGPIDLGRRLSPLEPELAEAVAAICGPVMGRMGYSVEAAPGAPA